MRWLEPEITTPVSVEPVSLDEAKAQVHVDLDVTDHDDILTIYISAARSYLEQITGLRLAPQDVVLKAWGLECSTFSIPQAPVNAITSIEYIDDAGATQTVSPSVYETHLGAKSSWIALAHNQSWPAHRCGLGYVTFTLDCGYTAIPEPLKQAMLLIIGDWFANRETVVVGSVSFSIPLAAAVDALTANFRRSYI